MLFEARGTLSIGQLPSPPPLFVVIDMQESASLLPPCSSPPTRSTWGGGGRERKERRGLRSIGCYRQTLVIPGTKKSFSPFLCSLLPLFVQKGFHRPCSFFFKSFVMVVFLNLKLLKTTCTVNVKLQPSIVLDPITFSPLFKPLFSLSFFSSLHTRYLQSIIILFPSSFLLLIPPSRGKRGVKSLEALSSWWSAIPTQLSPLPSERTREGRRGGRKERRRREREEELCEDTICK